MAICGHCLVGADFVPSQVNEVVSRGNVFESDSPLYDYLENKLICTDTPWAKLYKRKIFDSLWFPLNMSLHEDTCVFPVVLSRVRYAVICKEVLYFYRQHPSSAIGSGRHDVSLGATARIILFLRQFAIQNFLTESQHNTLQARHGLAPFFTRIQQLVLDRQLDSRSRSRMLQTARIHCRTLKQAGILSWWRLNRTQLLVYVLALRFHCPRVCAQSLIILGKSLNLQPKNKSKC